MTYAERDLLLQVKWECGELECVNVVSTAKCNHIKEIKPCELKSGFFLNSTLGLCDMADGKWGREESGALSQKRSARRPSLWEKRKQRLTLVLTNQIEAQWLTWDTCHRFCAIVTCSDDRINIVSSQLSSLKFHIFYSNNSGLLRETKIFRNIYLLQFQGH